MMRSDWIRNRNNMKNMTATQLNGAIVFAVCALAVYFFAFYLSFNQKPVASTIPYVDKNSGPVIVEITGDTGFNGIYYLPENVRVSDVLSAAGVTEMEILDRNMLDLPLSQGKTIEITFGGGIKILEMANAKKMMLHIPININRATSADLILVPGIGEKTAAQIIQFRRVHGGFHRLEDLMKISGIKEKKFAILEKYFTVK